MMWGWDWGWGAWLAMSVLMVLFWGLVIAGVVALVRYAGAGHTAARPDAGSGRADAENVLAERFARGEIDEDEYKRRSDLLRAGR
ncbi:SHOCT domain-containing protein [Frankia sp. Cppng1_Ct_nod]|uniref:SHOCT domain-containing protein n=1 Tax=Frankia sp. Cppng1_Ct_nod TaxID=2897162 RepID=UPI001041AD27|nr:SHOCT domain-containing protein [Frankia sp. Cppng1_Ct_nod]